MPHTTESVWHAQSLDYVCFGIYLIINLSVLSLEKSSPAPKVVTVQKPVVPPPPPPRKPLTVPNVGLTPEKPPQSPSTKMWSTILPNQPLENNGRTTSNLVDFFTVIYNVFLQEE